ncbi:ATP-dependent helicase [Kineococcus sp. R8]|nr:ATP-dependent helicase [Kineococcus siccus]
MSRSVGVLLPTTPAGRPVASTARPRDDLVLRVVPLPVVEVAGAEVLAVLAEVDAAAGVPAGDGLRWLAHVARGALALLDAGRVVPDLAPAGPRADGAADGTAGAATDDGAQGPAAGEWYARWVPLPDRRTNRWRAAVAEAAPPVLRAEVDPAGAPGRTPPRAATTVLDEVAQLVVDLTAARRTERVLPGSAPQAPAVRAWLAALRTGAPVTGAGSPAALARRVREWQRSGEDEGYELVLRVVEPDPWEEDVLHAARDGAEDGDARDHADTDADGVEEPAGSWTLQARLRPLDDPSLTLTLAEARAEASGPGGGSGGEDPLLVLLTGTARAGAAHPPLRRLLSGAADADVELGLADLLDLVEVGGPQLTAAGVPLQLPARWTRPQVSFSLSGSAVQPGVVTDPRLRRDDLVAFRWQAALGGTDIGEAELRALARAKSDLVKFRGAWVHVDRDALQRSAEFLRRRGSGRATVVDVLGAVASARTLPGPVTGVRADGVLGELLSGEAEQRLVPVPVPAGLRAQLRPYQERGLTWLAAMSRLGLGAVLADDMGLGKTVQLLALLLHEQETSPGTGPTLLVCPMSVVGNWEAEARRFAPGLRVHVHHGTARPRGEEFLGVAAAHDLVVTTYGLVVRDVEDLARVAWRRVALDEAQHVKNAATRAARAVRAVGAQHRVALTGTPVENRLEDLRAVLDATNPGLLGSAATFRDTFAVPVEKLGHAEPARRLALITRPFVLRRLKTDPLVAGDLPEKIEMTVRANLTPEQAGLYQAVVDAMLAKLADAEGMERRGLVLSTLTRLKQVCNHPAHYLGDGSPLLHRGRHRSGKLQLLDDVVDAAHADGEKVLVFTQFAAFGRMLAPHLSERTGAEVPFLHGGVGRRERDAMVAGFAGAGGPAVMLLSLKAGGTGLNLTAANHVVHVDRWWNPAVEDQATDRAYRIGQRRSVQVRKVVSAGTVEERIDDMITRKRDLAESVVGRGEGWITELDADALAQLVALGADAVGD